MSIPPSCLAYSLAYHPTISNMETLQNSTKGVFPASLLSQFPEQTSSSTPMTLMIQGKEAVRPLYVTAHEFSAQEGTIYLPLTLMQHAFIQEGERVELQPVSLPKVKEIGLRPTDSRFAKEIDDPKARLEQAIVERYHVLSVGDLIQLNGDDPDNEPWILEVEKLEPATTLSTTESDPSVEFLPSWEDIRREEERQRVLDAEKRKAAEQALEAREAQAQAVKEATDAAMNERRAINGYIPFEGNGNRLDGRPSSQVSSVASPVEPPVTPPVKRPASRAFAQFSGTGQRLGSSADKPKEDSPQ